MGLNPGMTLHHGGPFRLSYTAIRILLAGFNHRRRYIMNAKYYEYVNEKKIKFQKEWEE
jgi:hypothetical protein